MGLLNLALGYVKPTVRNLSGNAVDYLGNKIGAKEYGVSELIAGGPTKRTGTKPLTRVSANVGEVAGVNTDGPLYGPNPDPYALPTTTGGSGGSYGSGSFSFLGRNYGSQAAMEAAQNAYLDQVYGRQLEDLYRQEAQNLSDLGTQFSRSVGYDIGGPRRSFTEAGGTVGENRESFLRSIVNALTGVDDQETGALNQIGAFYSNLGDGYQSSEGYLRGKTSEQAKKGRENLNEQRTTGLRQLEQQYNDFIDSALRNEVEIKYSGEQARNSLAEGFAGARGGFIPEDIESVAGGLRGRIAGMNAAQIAGAPGVTQQQVDNYQRLLDDLIASRSSSGNARAFGSRQSQAAALNPILAYLAGVGA